MAPLIVAFLPKLLPALLVVVGLFAALVVQIGIAVEVYIQRAEPRPRMIGVFRVINGSITAGAFLLLAIAVVGAAYGVRRILVKPANLTVPEGYESAKPQ